MVKTSSIQTSHAGAIFRGWVDNQSASPSGGESSGTSSTPQANNSGADIAAGSAVVLLDDGTIELADVAQDTRPIGIAIDDIDDGETGPIAWQGPVSLILTTGSVTAGEFIETTTTPGETTGNATPQTGSFGYFTGSGTDPSGFLGSLPGTSATGGSGTDPVVADKVTRTAGDFATTSTSFVDVTGMSVTITTGARRCLVIVTGDFFATLESIILGIDIDGTLQGGTLGSVSVFDSGNRNNISFTIMTGVLSAASHTFKLQCRSAGGGTVTIDADSGRPLELAVVELATS